MQQLFRLLIFLIQPYVFRATNSPILRSIFWLYIQLLVQCTGRQQCRCIVPKAVHTVKKCSWGWANLSPETCRAELKRLINEKLLLLVGCLHRWTTVILHLFHCIFPGRRKTQVMACFWFFTSVAAYNWFLPTFRTNILPQFQRGWIWSGRMLKCFEH